MRRRFSVADLFCGAGGTSTGCLRAVREMGAELDLVAINHWDTAIATHTRNHPFARHFCINLDAANPAAIVEGGRLDLCWPALNASISRGPAAASRSVTSGVRAHTTSSDGSPR